MFIVRSILVAAVFLIGISSHCQVSAKLEYHPEVVGISANGLTQGWDAMKSYLKEFENEQGARVNSESLKRIAVHQRMDFEIGAFETDKGNRFANISIWVKGDDSSKRILEAIYETASNENNNVIVEIAMARKKWVELCNAHDAEKLVIELYTEDAIYYNRGRLLIGREKLSAEYNYMNNPSYSLDLTPSHLLKVTDEMVFELGMCSGSYNLPYLLIWKKEADGNWRIYFDSNY